MAFFKWITNRLMNHTHIFKHLPKALFQWFKNECFLFVCFLGFFKDIWSRLLFFRAVLGSPRSRVESRAQSFQAFCPPFPQTTVRSWLSLNRHRHRRHPQPTAHVRVPPWWCAFCGFWQMRSHGYRDRTTRNRSTALKSLPHPLLTLPLCYPRQPVIL